MAITQAEVAAMCGVSRATVDRVVNSRGHVDPEVEARIRKVLRDHHYRPNPAGRALVKAKSPGKIAVILSQAETPSVRLLLEYLCQYRDFLRAGGVELTIFEGEGEDIEKQLSALSVAKEEHFSAVSLLPVQSEIVRQSVQKLTASGIPLATFHVDLPHSGRLFFVGEDNARAGRAAANLLSRLLPAGGTILLDPSSEKDPLGRERLKGFQREIRTRRKDLALLETLHAEDLHLAEKTLSLLQTDKSIRGIYAPSGGIGAARALEKSGRADSVRLICHDLTDEIRPCLKRGIVDFVLDQDLKSQAELPLQLLRDHILSGKAPGEELLNTRISYFDAFSL